MSMGSPPLTKKDFAFLASATKAEASARFAPFISDLRDYLSVLSPLKDIQKVRGIRPRGRAFVKDGRFEQNHWWFSHDGGRSEAQWNVGMFPCHIRFGIGFNVSGGGFPNRPKLNLAVSRFTKALQERLSQDRKSFERTKIQVEIYESGRLHVVPVSDWPTNIEHWVMIGRFLRSGSSQTHDGCQCIDDSETLADPELLGQEFERVAAFLWPLWLAATKPWS